MLLYLSMLFCVVVLLCCCVVGVFVWRVVAQFLLLLCSCGVVVLVWCYGLFRRCCRFVVALLCCCCVGFMCVCLCWLGVLLSC